MARVSRFVGSGDKIGLFVLPFVIIGVLLNVRYPWFFGVGGPPVMLAVLSAVVLVPGLVGWIWSVVLILRHVPRDELITTGPFALVKHPLYTAVALLVLPWAGFLLDSWLGVVLGLALYAGSRIFAPAEERTLAQQFGFSPGWRGLVGWRASGGRSTPRAQDVHAGGSTGSPQSGLSRPEQHWPSWPPAVSDWRVGSGRHAGTHRSPALSDMTRLARMLLSAVVRLLPRGARRRYEEELDVELLHLAPAGRLSFASSLLVSVPWLRWEVLAGLSGGRPSLRCRRCGHVRDPRQYLQADNADGVAWGGAYLSGSGGL